MTKKQRQNAAKREAQKAAKAEAEAQRLATLSKHKRELEKAKIVEQYSKKDGGSSASVNDKGHLVWD
jgi:DNA-binding protein H-NS